MRNLKFLHCNKRPGEKEIDFIDQMLILEMRKEEPEWVDYSKDKQMVKEKVAKDLFEALLSESNRNEEYSGKESRQESHESCSHSNLIHHFIF